MNNPSIGRFPPGWLVIALLAASVALWAVLFFVTLPHLQFLAGGAAPFDARFAGYSFADARAFLAAIGAEGRAYYLNPELVLDTFFPFLYAASRALALWWLTMPERLRNGTTPGAVRWTLMAVVAVETILDLTENSCIAAMIWTWPDLSPPLVLVSSLATRLKLLAAALIELTMLALAAVTLLRRLRARK
jgi:hypothetical protein